MPNVTSFAVQYKKLIDHNFEPDPRRLSRTRSSMLAQLSAEFPSSQSDRLWTRTKKSDTINNDEETGEEKK